MKPDGPLKLLSEVRDLQIEDAEGCNCGICDDLLLDDDLQIEAILVGPGAWRNRMPAWLWPVVALITGRSTVRVPWTAVGHVTSRIVLKQRAIEVGLGRDERRWSRRLPHWPHA